MPVGDRFTVLRDGRRVGSLPIQEFKRDSVIWMMAGRSVDEMYPRAHRCARTGAGGARPSPPPHNPAHDLVVRRGEVVGLGGLVGSGRTELAKSVFGARRFHGGEVRYLGAKIDGWGPGRLIRAGIAYLSEDRKTEGSYPAMSIRENSLSPRFFGSSGSERSPQAKERPKPPSNGCRSCVLSPGLSNRRCATLSGGNQQRTVFAKWPAPQSRGILLAGRTDTRH